MNCPQCERELKTVLALHRYNIKYDEEQKKWIKSCGEAEYACSMCLERLDTHDIEDILRQVDEL